MKAADVLNMLQNISMVNNKKNNNMKYLKKYSTIHKDSTVISVTTIRTKNVIQGKLIAVVYTLRTY